jgi:hypothetical protein
LEFVSNYKFLLFQKREAIFRKSQIYKNELNTLENTRLEVEKKSTDLEKKKQSVDV